MLLFFCFVVEGCLYLFYSMVCSSWGSDCIIGLLLLLLRFSFLFSMSITTLHRAHTHTQANFATPGLREYHERLQFFLLFYIESSSYIDSHDPIWQLLLVCWLVCVCVSCPPLMFFKTHRVHHRGGRGRFRQRVSWQSD